MPNLLAPIYFYLPARDRRDDFPGNPNAFWPHYGRGQYSWTLQTYLQLKTNGIKCELIDTMPAEGIVLAHRDDLPYELRPTSKLLIVCLKADQNCHPYAQIHVVQNYQEFEAKPLWIQSISEDRYLLPGRRYYMPHWPQPGLIPRNIARGDKFENVAFFGISYNLAPELRGEAWKQHLAKLNLNWSIVKERWHDYSEVDAIVAARSFDSQNDYSWKPATKLYNAWRAGVPAILTPESAFRGERKSELDYIEVSSPEDILAGLKRLRDDLDFRRSIVENGKLRAQEIDPQNLVKRWRFFLTDTCIPAYDRWCSLSSWQRKKFFLERDFAQKISTIQRRILRFGRFFNAK